MMTDNDWKRALESATKALSKIGAAAEATGASIDEAAKKLRETAHCCNMVYGRANIAAPLDAQVAKAWENAVADAEKEELKKQPMIDKEYTSVYSDAEFDFDKKKTEFASMTESTIDIEKTTTKQETEIKGCRIVLRNDTSSNWEDATIIPLKGEICIEYSDDGRECHAKCGDGVRPFRELPYITSPVSITTETVSALGPQGEKFYDFITSSYIDF